MSKFQCAISACLVMVGAVQGEILCQDNFDNDTLMVNASGIGGGAVNQTIQTHAWVDDGDATLVINGTANSQRAMLYSENTFQSDTGFRLRIKFTTGFIGDAEAYHLAFGLISSDTDLSTYDGYNPFREGTNVYSIGANVTADGGEASRGLNFTDGPIFSPLDASGTRAQFTAGEACVVTIEIGIGGYWSYRINGVYEASGVLLEGFDLTKNYYVVVYAQDDNGGDTSIQSLQLETAYAAGERAAGIRGNWNGGEGDLERIKDFKTLDSVGLNFSDGATLSAQHFAPHKLLETIALEGVDGTGPAIDFVVAPSWGDLSLDEPENDAFLARLLEIRAAGFKVKGYSNSENFVGSNQTYLQEFVDRWLEYCDTNPEIQAFINSQPFHTGVWNRTTQQYEDASATYPNRKYMFCYAEFVLKDYALRYGSYFSSWIFDDGSTMEQNGDNATSGILEEQRIYQAFANAIHAGNPEVPLAFNNGRSTVNYNSFPFAHAVRFDDFTFGHAFGGNNDHASKTGTQFVNNYKHITRMTATDGYVHDGGNWEWDDLIVGNLHSKLSTTAWKYGTNQAWEETDFFQWNLEAMHAGGHMTWNGSIWRSDPTLQGWALTLLEGLDHHLAKFQFPGAPNWARAYTVLPQAFIGQAYTHVLEEGIDLWDPEGDEITAVAVFNGAPSWLNISEDPLNPGHWILSGIPTERTATEFSFSVRATDVNGLSRDRAVEMNIAVPKYLAMATRSINGGAYWTDLTTTDEDLTYYNSGTKYTQRALTYSTEVFKSPGGVRLTVWYTIGTISDSAAHQLSFGLIRDDTDLPAYDGYNPFGATEGSTSNVFSLGVSVVAADEHGQALFQGLCFNDGSARITLDQSGDLIQFAAGVSTPVVIEIRPNGAWSYSINGITEASGVIAGGFDLSKSYHVAIYGQDDHGGGKSIQSVSLDLLDAPGSFAAWASDHGLMGGDAQADADSENGGVGDGYNNLAEYALGMNPTHSDAGSRDWINFATEGGTNYFELVHNRRSDYKKQGLTYLLIDSTNLVDSGFSTNAQDQILVGPEVDGYEPVTNRFRIVDPIKFIELKIRHD